MRHADIKGDMDARMNHACKLAAGEAIRKAREMKRIPSFGRYIPGRHTGRKKHQLLIKAIEETREQIRSAFGLPKDSTGE